MAELSEVIFRIRDAIDGVPPKDAVLALVLSLLECVDGDRLLHVKAVRGLITVPTPEETKGLAENEFCEAVDYSMSTHH